MRGAGDRPIPARWIGATTFGWIAGFILTLAFAMAWDAVGGGAQFMVGLGMGLGVGSLQGWLGGRWVGAAGSWIARSTIGMTAPFLVWDLAAAAGLTLSAAFALPLCGSLGGLLAGLLQRPHLERIYTGAGRWPLASFAGWAIPVGLIALGDAVESGAGGPLSAAAMLFGGLPLGLVTAGALRSLRPNVG